MITSAPNRIWLVTGTDEPCDVPWHELDTGAVCWSEQKEYRQDVEYRRVKRRSSMHAENAHLRAALEEILKQNPVSAFRLDWCGRLVTRCNRCGMQWPSGGDAMHQFWCAVGIADRALKGEAEE